MKELTRDKKIAVVELVLNGYNGHYLCPSLTCSAMRLRLITPKEYMIHTNSETAQTLIPEILLFKPEGRRDSHSWFGCADIPESIEKRRKVLEELLSMLKNQK
jgi:hypothetical protein